MNLNGDIGIIICLAIVITIIRAIIKNGRRVKETRYRRILAILDNDNFQEHGVLTVRPHKLPPEQDVIRIITTDCENFIRQAQESYDIVGSTMRPDTFYSRYEFLLKRLNTLSEVEKLWPHPFKYVRPTEMLQRMNAEGYELEIAMWNRFFDEAQMKAACLKTEKGRNNALNRAVQTASTFVGKVSPPANEAILQRIQTINTVSKEM